MVLVSRCTSSRRVDDFLTMSSLQKSPSTGEHRWASHCHKLDASTLACPCHLPPIIHCSVFISTPLLPCVVAYVRCSCDVPITPPALPRTCDRILCSAEHLTPSAPFDLSSPSVHSSYVHCICRSPTSNLGCLIYEIASGQSLHISLLFVEHRLASTPPTFRHFIYVSLMSSIGGHLTLLHFLSASSNTCLTSMLTATHPQFEICYHHFLPYTVNMAVLHFTIFKHIPLCFTVPPTGHGPKIA